MINSHGVYISNPVCGVWCVYKRWLLSKRKEKKRKRKGKTLKTLFDMAKKKVSHKSHSENLKQQKPPTTPPLPMASDDAVQILNLKNLNAVLLKETTHRRQQIDSLHSALCRSAVSSDVLSVFIQTHVADFNHRLHALLAHSNSDHARLRDNLAAERNLREQAAKLLSEREAFFSRKLGALEDLQRERDSALASSRHSLSAVEALKEELRAVTRERDEIKSVSDVRAGEIAALKDLSECLKKEEVLARDKILRLEENLGLALRREEEMTAEVAALLKEKKGIESAVDLLSRQKSSVMDDLVAVRRELKEKKHELDEAVKLSDEMEQVKVNCESEIVELRRQVDESKGCCRKVEEENEKLLLEVKRCRDAVFEMENMKRRFDEENEQLLSEVKRFRDAVDEALIEKESIGKLFDGERKKVDKLELAVAGTKEVVAKTEAELGKVRSERDKLFQKEKMLEGNVSALREKNGALESKLEEALALLKTTAAALVCQVKDRGEEDGNVVVGEIDPYVQELDAIKKAFKSKDETVDDMKKQIVSLNRSVERAQKSKNLWTVISSATTIFVAVLTAYVARAR
ncbi:hypothetical protein Fmac_024515 [Flemingia macrophylla]|uniref:Uncharacterized protein n=1 Tax=Flemingia macrophylla TaxID=520843 RepID=A0ABD1LPL5_9FABA